MAQLTLSGINKTFDKNIHVLKEINLSVEDSELLVIVGPSGCGKTTLLRLIAGLESLDKGEIKLGSNLIHSLPPQKRDVAIMFQNYVLLPHMTAFENMAFGLRLRKVAKMEIAKKVKHVAETLGIAGLLDRYPHALSGGQRQRIALGRAILRQPLVFLLDEPLSNLDAQMRNQMRLEIRQIQKKMHTTMVFVTHDQTEAMTMGDRIAVMKGGVILQIDTPENIYHKPNSLFVASFLGSPGMNFIRGRLKDHTFRNADLEIRLTEPLCNQIRASGKSEVILGVRPENLSLSGKEQSIPSGLPWVRVKMDEVEYLGAQSCYRLSAGATHLVAVTKPCDKGGPGATLRMHIDLNNACLFDPSTEKALSQA